MFVPPLTNSRPVRAANNPARPDKESNLQLENGNGADWPMPQNGSGMGTCQVGQSLCALCSDLKAFFFIERNESCFFQQELFCPWKSG
jgi:hypothetical protein